jgi:hypothetical protein
MSEVCTILPPPACTGWRYVADFTYASTGLKWVYVALMMIATFGASSAGARRPGLAVVRLTPYLQTSLSLEGSAPCPLRIRRDVYTSFGAIVVVDSGKTT